LKAALWILFCVLLAGLARTHNLRDVFIDGQIYFVDADCYSRMTRARAVAVDGAGVVRHHLFENYPEGTEPHTTAPLDYLIVGVQCVLDLGFRVFEPQQTSILRGQTLDLAGALVSPLLGMFTCGFLGLWATTRRLCSEGDAPARLRCWGLAPLFFAISPVLVHGTVLGRPDHQSLLLALVAVALCAELALVERSSRHWSIVAGVAWALSLWVSLYEPLLLLLTSLALWLGFDRRPFWTADRRVGLACGLAVLTLALLVEGWRFHWPDAALREAFLRWKQTIGELNHLDLRSPLLFQWLGWGVLGAPAIFFLSRREDLRVIPLGILLLVTLGLTFSQLRWGYFLALIFALTLPWQAIRFKRPWLVWLAFCALLWPMLRDWDEQLFPNSNAQRQLTLQRREAVLLRQLAARMSGPEEQPFLAPWWLSPPLAYWSGQPGVAGSSHQSLPGILDSASFYLSDEFPKAAAILRERKVRWVIADEASRAINTSALLLGVAPPLRPLALILAEEPQLAPDYLQSIDDPARVAGEFRIEEPQFYRLYRVNGAKVHP
jgi:hypothetical protein